MNILQVNTSDTGGGAERVSWHLFQAYHNRGHHSWLAVGTKYSHNPNVFLIPNNESRNWQTRVWSNTIDGAFFLVKKGRVSIILKEKIKKMGRPKRLWEVKKGWEDFNFPGTQRILNSLPGQPEIIHCHNLHANYFDLRFLPQLSKQVPMVITLHDMWCLTGHCAHSFACERWKTGCGHCPDITIYPPIQRDGTAYNWKRKQDIYSRSRLHVAAPSQWLMDKAKQSILNKAAMEWRVIPNGVDISLFHPEKRDAVRSELGLPQNAKILLFAASGIGKQNSFKDSGTLLRAVEIISGKHPEKKILFVILGENVPIKQTGRVEIRFIPYQKDQKVVTRYYQAADVYLHAAHADTFPNSVLEALACGTPVIATATGGIPEQIREGVTGFLVPPGDADAIARSIERFLGNDDLRLKMGTAARKDACERFDLNRQVAAYLEWYGEIVAAWTANKRKTGV